MGVNVPGQQLFDAVDGIVADARQHVAQMGLCCECRVADLGASFPRLLGLGEAVVYPSCNRTVASWIPVSERGAANGLIFAGVGADAGITPSLITLPANRFLDLNR